MIITEINPTSLDDLRLKRVAAYARVSAEKDTAEHSLAQQISYYNEYISNHPGWEFAGVYADEGISGTRAERPEFQRLLTDCRAGKIDLIITKSVTRLARNTVTLLETVRELKTLGIEVFFENENIWTMSEIGELMLSLLAMYAEEEARTASENKRWQIRRDFERGRPTYVRLYGYQWTDGHLEIIPEEADVVRRIFSEYLSGKGTTAISKGLNADGIPSLVSRWNRSCIYEILRNEKYAGDLLLQKWHIPDFRTKIAYKNDGQWRKYLVEDSHEAIIDKATFQAVQEEIENRKKKAPGITARTEKTLFAGILKCGLCKASYKYRNRWVKTSKAYIPTWFCNTAWDHGKEACKGKQIRESILVDKAKEVLGLSPETELTREIIVKNITSIESAADNQLRFFLADGTVKVIRWENPSRRESWTPEMKQIARERTLAQNKKRKEAQDD